MPASERLPRTLVTGATGKTGRVVAAQLLERGWPVRALVRPGSPHASHLRSLGAEVVAADLFDVEAMLAALRGTQRAYYCPPFHPLQIQAAAVFAAAAREAGLEAIVGLSQWTASSHHPSLATRQQWLTERLLGSLPGIAYANLNPGYFADNYLRLVDFASLLGLFPILTGSSRNAPPSNDDIARVAVALLMDPEPHAGRSYRPTGPDLLSALDIAAIVRRVLGHPVLPVNLPLPLFLRAARLQGVSAFELSSLRHYLIDHRQGIFEHGAPTQVVQDLTGRPPEDMETLVRRYLALPFARPTVANRLRALLSVLVVPFVPPYDLDRFDRTPFPPRPVGAAYGMGSERWRREHPPGLRPAPFA